MEEKIYVPNNWKIQEQILQENHEPANIRHLGQQKMLKLIKKNYWWPEILNNIKKYTQRYQKYQQNFNKVLELKSDRIDFSFYIYYKLHKYYYKSWLHNYVSHRRT